MKWTIDEIARKIFCFLWVAPLLLIAVMGVNLAWHALLPLYVTYSLLALAGAIVSALALLISDNLRMADKLYYLAAFFLAFNHFYVDFISSAVKPYFRFF